VVPVEQERVYVWDRVVRITHWTIALSIVVLAVTGIYIGNPFLVAPGEATGHFIMGWMRIIHFYTAIAFTLAVLVRLVWMFIGTKHARWQNFVPVTKSRWKKFFQTVSFYGFLRWLPPPLIGHNPVAGAAYTAIFGLYLVMIATGLGLYSVSAHVDSPMRWFEFLLSIFGGAQSARWIHHVVMWLLLGFVVHHVYSALLVSIVEKNGTLDSIFSGYKWHAKDEDEV
jgi:Ni/Fe-hydrogenase 1 B-type cytochrome subunit